MNSLTDLAGTLEIDDTPSPISGDDTETLDLPTAGDNHHHLTSIPQTLTIRQLRSQGLSFQLWPAASTLVALLDRDPAVLRLPSPPPSGRLRLLELGSGTGLVGIAAAAVLGADVTLTDLPHVLPNLRFNADANAAALAAAGGALDVRPLRWGHAEDCDAFVGEAAVDAVLASDVVYYESLFEPLLETLRVLVKGESRLVMAHLRRWKRRDAVFFRKARKFFDVALLHSDAPSPGARIGVAVYSFAAKQRSGGDRKSIVQQCQVLDSQDFS